MHWSVHIHPENWQHSHSAGHVAQMWVQNVLVIFEKLLKTKTYSLNNDNFASGDFIEQIEKLVEIGTLYHLELLKRRPSVGAFCFSQ
jgi:hypothetical protein